MRGILFDDHAVDLDPRTARVGGSWEGQQQGDVLGTYDPDAIRLVWQLLKNKSPAVLFDVGANTGSYTLLPVLHKTLTVHAFEPAPYVYDILVANCAINALRGVVKLNALALSDTTGMGVLQVPDQSEQLGLTTLDARPHRCDRWHPVTVQTATLDHYCDMASLSQLDVMKIDTEGSELAILRGGEATIKHFRPVLLVEYQAMNTRQHAYEPEAIRELLSGWGYLCQMAGEQDMLCVPQS
jgi:FkbM family methyltransferase